MNLPQGGVDGILAGLGTAHGSDGKDVDAAKRTAPLFRANEQCPATCRSEELVCEKPEQHPPDQRSCDEGNCLGEDFSMYSDPEADGWKLKAADWFRIVVKGGAKMDDTEGTRYFHGTTLLAFTRIVRLGQGFVVGEGGHRVGPKTFKRMWLMPRLSRAWFRADPSRCNDDKGRPTFLGCPVAVEVTTGAVKRVPGTDKYCKIGVPGQPIQGVKILAVHFNADVFRNWAKFAKPEFLCALKDVLSLRST